MTEQHPGVSDAPEGAPTPPTRRLPASFGPIARFCCAFAVIGALLVTAFGIDALSAAPAQPPIRGTLHNGPPLRVLLVGDSLAGTLGVGLARAAPASNVELVNGAQIGCGVAIAWNRAWASTVEAPVPPAYPCQSAQQLSAYWASLLRRVRPDVVIYASHMDTIDQEVSPGSASMVSVADPAFAARLTEQLTQAVAVLHQTGAAVIVTNAAPTKTNLVGSENDAPANLAAYNQVVTAVAARSNGVATVFDLAGALGLPGSPPTFSLTSPSDIEWRCLDGIHVSQAGGELVAPALFSLAWRVTPSPPRPPLAAAPARPPGVNQPWPPYVLERHAMGCPQ